MSKLLCVIVDGLRAETLACAHVPCFDALAREGVLSLHLQPARPGLTLPTLVSLLTSLPPEEHGVLCNSAAARVSPHAVSLFSLLRYRHQTSAAFYSHDRLRLLFPPGSLQTGLLINSQAIRNVDRELAEQAARHLQREKPDCCLLYLEGANIAATHFGLETDAYLESVEQADRALGLLLEHLTVVGLRRDYVTMVLGCGATDRPRAETTEPCLPLLLSGPGLRKGQTLDRRPLSLLDLAPTMAALLGVAPHPDWHGRVLAEAFHHSPLELKPARKKKRPDAGDEGHRSSAGHRQRRDPHQTLIPRSPNGNTTLVEKGYRTAAPDTLEEPGLPVDHYSSGDQSHDPSNDPECGAGRTIDRQPTRTGRPGCDRPALLPVLDPYPGRQGGAPPPVVGNAGPDL